MIDYSSVNSASSNRPKSAISESNITREKRKSENCSWMATRALFKELKFSKTSVWRILRKELEIFFYNIQIKQA